MTRLYTTALALLVLLAAAPAAQDMYVRQARIQLADIARGAFGAGWELTHDVVTGALPEHGRDLVRLRLRGGQTYAIAATCDEDCSDIDLELFDPSGALVSRDVGSDDTPVVTSNPSLSGTYRVRLTMASCRTDPCRYAVGVFGR
jgi:hypothetical protein